MNRTTKKNNDTSLVPEIEYIWIADGYEYTRLEISNILYAESSYNKIAFYLNEMVENKNSLISTISIGEWERELEDSKMLRVNNRFMVNIDYITKFNRSEGGRIFMSDGLEINVSPKWRTKLMSKLRFNLKGQKQ